MVYVPPVVEWQGNHSQLGRPSARCDSMHGRVRYMGLRRLLGNPLVPGAVGRLTHHGAGDNGERAVSYRNGSLLWGRSSAGGRAPPTCRIYACHNATSPKYLADWRCRDWSTNPQYWYLYTSCMIPVSLSGFVSYFFLYLFILLCVFFCVVYFISVVVLSYISRRYLSGDKIFV